LELGLYLAYSKKADSPILTLNQLNAFVAFLKNTGFLHKTSFLRNF